jgi:hypothetical protein
VDLARISEETLEEIAKAAATSGITSSTGLNGVDLSPYVNLIPVNTPFFDELSHETPEMGNTFAQWKAIVNVNNLQADPATPLDWAAPLALIQEMDVTAPYGKVGEGYTVTRDAVAIGRGYIDAKATAIANALFQWKIGMDKKSLGGQRFALTVPTGGTVTPATTGGTIPLSTAVVVRVAARTQSNYFYGGSTAAAANVSATTGAGTSTNSAVAFCTSVRGAVAYDWFVAGFYYTTTTVNKVTITNIPVANAAFPPALPGLYGVAPTAVPTVDASAKPNDFNGLLATLAGDYATGGATGLVTPGSGVASGATFSSLDGNPFTVTGQNIAEVDALNLAIFNAVNLSPDEYLVSSQTASEMSSAIMATAGGGTTVFEPTDDGRSAAVAGAFVGFYMNKAAGGKLVKINIMPNLAPGTLIAKTNTVPFPNSNITNVLALRDLDPVYSYEYGSSRLAGQAGGGPRDDGENLTLTTLVNRAPVAMGVIQNIG